MKIFFYLAVLLPLGAEAKLNVIASTSDLAALVREVGGDALSVEGLAKGTQDPHFLEAKPSYMLKLSKADLLVTAGLGLETGWIPSLVRGARNPKIRTGERGFLELGPSLEPIEAAQGKVTRAEGDVHPEGNPHFHLDPIRMGQAGLIVAARLAELDPSNAAAYSKRAQAFAERMKGKTAAWEARIRAAGVKSVVSFHKTLSYFFARFGLKNPVTLEPKPGIPPTSAHILSVIRTMKEQQISIVLVENYFDPAPVKKIAPEVPGLRSVLVAVSVEGEPGIQSTDELIERLVKAVEGK